MRMKGQFNNMNPPKKIQKNAKVSESNILNGNERTI